MGAVDPAGITFSDKEAVAPTDFVIEPGNAKDSVKKEAKNSVIIGRLFSVFFIVDILKLVDSRADLRSIYVAPYAKKMPQCQTTAWPG
jgi:hypothetical protein